MHDPAHRTMLLLTAAAHPDPGRAREAWQRLSEGIGTDHDVVTWLQAGPHQRLMPMLSSRSQVLGLHGLVDMACEQATAVGWALNVRIIEEIGPVITAWRSAGIDALALKGLALIGDVHPEHRFRPLGDADLLVPDHRRAEAFDLMGGLGWRVSRRHRWHVLGRGTAVNLGNGTGVSIDLHRRSARTMPVPDQRRLWNGATMLPAAHPLAPSGLRRLGPVQHALALIAHASAPTALAHQLVDVHLHLTTLPALRADDGAALAEALAEHHLAARAARLLGLLHEVLGTPVPPRVAAVDPRPDRVEARILAAEARLAEPPRTATITRRALDHVRLAAAGEGPGGHVAAAAGTVLRFTAARLDH